MKTYLLIAIGLMLLFCVVLIVRTENLKEENKVLASNQESLLTSNKKYVTKDSLNAISVQRLQLTKDELEQYYSKQIEVAKNAGIKLGRIQAISEIGTKTEYIIQTKAKDSIVYLDTLKCFNYSDAWMKLQGCVKVSTVNLSYSNVDTLVQVVHRIPKKWWFFRWGTKAIEQTIISKNPNTRFEYSRYIEVK